MSHDDTDKVVSLDDFRIRTDREFEDEQMAYVEALWGKESFAYNAAIRDMEAMRRGDDDKTLRPPETFHEVYLMVMHIRALANDIARHYGLTDLVRIEDDVGHPTPDPEDPAT